MADIGDLHAIAEELLQHAADALDTIPGFDPALLGAPARQFISPGLPVWDCEQLAVYVPSIAELDTTPGGLDTGRRANRAWVNDVSLIVGIVRCCIPDEPTPSALALTAAAAQLHADAWALWNHLHNVKSSGQFLSLCDEATFEPIIAAAPSGGCGGWTMTVRVALDGYQEPVGS